MQEGAQACRRQSPVASVAHQGCLIVEHRRCVPCPGDDLAPIDRRCVEDHLEARASLPGLDQEGRRRGALVGAPDDALARAGTRNVRVVAKVCILVHDDVEELAQAAVLLAEVLADRPAGPPHARDVGVSSHGHALARGEVQPVGVALQALLALPDLLAPRPRARGDDDLAVVGLHPDLHHLAHRAGDDPHLTLAEVVGAPHGHVQPVAGRHGRVDDLLRVVVANKLELLPPTDADLPLELEHVLGARLHLVEAAGVPRARDLVPVVVAQRPWNAVWRNLLPRDPPPALAPVELDREERAGGHAGVPAVDEPALAGGLHAGVGALHPDALVRLVAHRPELVVLNTVQADGEALAAGLAQRDGVHVRAVLLFGHLVIAFEAAPGAVDGDLHAVRVHQVTALVDLLAAIPEATLVSVPADVIGLELLAEAVGLDHPCV
mmetsp:Transcript_76259/g.223556  ORF Transcript_76259/g.223556 Transcript_76259/m.223556 type:complete len:436 (+) Transcript_76259:20-1327(+)